MALRTIGTGECAYQERSKHLTGIPNHLIDAVSDHVAGARLAGTRVTRGDVYGRAIREFMDAWRRCRAKPVIEAQAKGEHGGRVQFWGPEDLVDEFEAFCAEIGRDQSPTFIAALTRFVEREAKRKAARKGKPR